MAATVRMGMAVTPMATAMGTDTMAYAASAMSFMLENLAKTVVFTGSQIPFAEVYNDARRNLVVSLMSRSYPEQAKRHLLLGHPLAGPRL